ncbi:MAG: 4Fe-4S dicluster domain-containing protein [Desulfobacteraceae bacterium]|nr:4Fe-4S dicluster domain-containing protein [Desulfobacteraceae bacterium]
MIKRSFFSLSQPRLAYDLLEPDLKEPESIPVPAILSVLLPEPIDNTKQALIKKGDAVKKGEKLKLYDDSTAYTTSPVAGTIKLFDSYSDDFGNIATFITIKADPTQVSEANTINLPPMDDIKLADQFLRKLPGAPPFEILANDEIKITTIVITGTDTDLLSTTNQFVSLKYMDEVKEGAKILKKLTQVPKFCITIPENLDTKVSFDTIEVLKISNTYPSTLPAMIMKDHLNTVMSAGQTPEDSGICFIRAEALVSLARTYKTKKAVFDKVLTIISKNGTRHRIRATIGTPLSKIFARFNININEQDRIIIGGPMRGVATYTPHHPVLADMDTVIIQDRDIIPQLSDYPCVNCGKCIRICPANIPVNMLVRYLEVDQYENAADKFDLESCIDCGLCAYVCTARIPLHQYIRLGKHELLTLRADA